MSTNKIGLIIQGTLSGLTNLIVSPNMTTLLESPVVKPSLLDERNEIAQFARNTNVFSLENNAQLNIYSIILTDKLDSFKRAGYVAIRLYFPNGVISQQPIAEVLNQLKEKYEEIAKNNSGNFEMYANQFFEIVASIRTTNSTQTSNLGIQKKACFGFDVNTENVSQKIQNLSAKTYFSKIYGVPTPLLGNLISNGYTDITNLTFQKLTINGMFPLVQSITVNNQSVAFKNNDFSLELNVLPTDQILINYKDGRNEVVSPHKGLHSLTQRQQARPNTYPGTNQKNTSKNNTTRSNILFLGGLALLLGGGLYFFWPKSETAPKTETYHKTPQNTDNLNINNTTTSPEITEYPLNGDTLECVVNNYSKDDPYFWQKTENKEQKIIKFRLYKDKFVGIWIPNKTDRNKISTLNSELTRIYKLFDLDSTEIQKTMNELINKKKTELLKKESNQQQKTVKQPIPVSSKKQATTGTASPAKKSVSPKTETKAVDDL
jgi:hypothetical protein